METAEEPLRVDQVDEVENGHVIATAYQQAAMSYIAHAPLCTLKTSVRVSAVNAPPKVECVTCSRRLGEASAFLPPLDGGPYRGGSAIAVGMGWFAYEPPPPPPPAPPPEPTPAARALDAQRAETLDSMEREKGKYADTLTCPCGEFITMGDEPAVDAFLDAHTHAMYWREE